MAIFEQPTLHQLSVTVRRDKPGFFSLDSSLLNSAATLASPTQVYEWTELLPGAVQSMTITRAASEVATVTLTVKDPSTTLRPGLEIYVTLSTHSVTMFRGVIRHAHTTTDDGHTYTTITATDLMPDLTNQTRYGAASGSDVPDTWLERVQRLMASRPDAIGNLAAFGVTYSAADAVYETSLASWLDTMVASLPDAYWRVNLAGRVDVRAGMAAASPTPEGTFSPSDIYNHFVYSDIELEYDTADVINELTITNHKRAQDDTGAWLADDRTATFSDVTSQATYGSAAASIDVCIANDADVATLAAAILNARSSPSRLPVTARCNAALYPWKHAGADLFMKMRVIDPTGAPDHMVYITGITHEISPSRWMVNYSFRKA